MRGPTVTPAANFDAKADAEKMRDSIGFLGGREEEIISVLCYRSSEQRQEIARWYKEFTGNELVGDLKSTLTGEFREIMICLCLSPAEFYAWELHKAIKDHRGRVVVEVLCSLNNRQIDEIVRAYHRDYNADLREDIESHSTFRKNPIYALLAMGNRDEGTGVDKERLGKSLKMLNDASNETTNYESHKYDTFCQILAMYSYEQLRAMFDAYEKPVGNSMDDLIRKEFAGHDKGEALIAVVQTIHHRITTFARNLESFYDTEVKCFGISNSQHDVIRTVVARSEIDLGDVLAKYEFVYGTAFLEESNDLWASSYVLALRILTGRSDIDPTSV
ncbi:annexin [Aphelenchoides avenae]|nr:annexin [Aphelenchus avenae]